MKFYYNNILVRTSKTRNYTHAVILELGENIAVVCCASDYEKAIKGQKKAANEWFGNYYPNYWEISKIVELDARS